MKSAASVSVIVAALLGLAGCERESTATPILGTLEWDRVELIAEAAEPIVEIAVREGDVVPAGGVVARLDDTRQRIEVAAAEAEIARLAALLAEQKAGARPEELDEARARVQQAATVLRNAKQELDRISTVRARGLVSAAELDRARNARDAQAADLNAATARLKLLESGTRAETVQQTEAALAAAKARRDTAALRVSRLRLAAPRQGRVETLPFEVGDQPAVGATVARLLVGGAPYALLYIPEAVRAQVVEGAPFEVRVEGIATPVTGRLRTIASEAGFTPYYALTGEDASRLVYRAEVELPASASTWPAGLPVQARLGQAKPAQTP